MDFRTHRLSRLPSRGDRMHKRIHNPRPRQPTHRIYVWACFSAVLMAQFPVVHAIYTIIGWWWCESGERQSSHHLFTRCPVWAPQTTGRKVWEDIGKACGWEHPRAPSVKWLFLRDTGAGGTITMRKPPEEEGDDLRVGRARPRMLFFPLFWWILGGSPASARTGLRQEKDICK